MALGGLDPDMQTQDEAIAERLTEIKVPKWASHIIQNWFEHPKSILIVDRRPRIGIAFEIKVVPFSPEFGS